VRASSPQSSQWPGARTWRRFAVRQAKTSRSRAPSPARSSWWPRATRRTPPPIQLAPLLGREREASSSPHVVRLTRDLSVYRLWAGPSVKDAQGRTSRIGQWWTFDAPAGTLASFRQRYEVCEKWDTLRFVAQCTLRRGSVVVIGPGQSVSAKTCGNPTESYPANDRDLQVYIHEAWNRPELSCPDESRDYEDDPRDISRPAAR